MTIIAGRERDLGGFHVRRILPFASHRMVGPFIFFDHMGPAELAPGTGMDVRPHPHINLATVTYLFEGVIRHRDSLGSDQLIEPGAINWMTAGRGIVHSERTPSEERARGPRLNGIQLWVALPEEHEEIAPTFVHHPKDSFPEFAAKGARVRLLLGRFFDRESPVVIHSDLFYAEVNLPKGHSWTLEAGGRESAVYVVTGGLQIEDRDVNPFEMAVADGVADLSMTAREDSRLMVLGGSPIGPRFIEWNFVSSSKDRIAHAKEEWSRGPQKSHTRFHPIPGDEAEFIPLPPPAIS